MSSKRCPACGVYSQATTERCDCGQSLLGVGVGTGVRQSQALQVAGAFLMAVGAALWAVSFFVFDVSVAVPASAASTLNMDRIANMERMDTRQNVVLVASALFVAGAVFFAAAPKERA